jgi:hypothetical protein
MDKEGNVDDDGVHVYSKILGQTFVNKDPGNRLIVRRLDQGRVPEGGKASIAFCVQPFRNSYDDVTQLVEFVEYHSVVSIVRNGGRVAEFCTVPILIAHPLPL